MQSTATVTLQGTYLKYVCTLLCPGECLVNRSVWCESRILNSKCLVPPVVKKLKDQTIYCELRNQGLLL